MDRAYLVSSRALNALLCLLGLGMLVSTVARGGGVFALGVILGALFAALGFARLLLTRGVRPDDE